MTCEDKKITLSNDADANTAAGKAASVTIEFEQEKGKVKCVEAGDANWVSFTAAAYAAPSGDGAGDGDAAKDGDAASGAMHLGAAFAAGALTIAATQF